MLEIKKQDYATPALDKGLDIMELLAHEPAGLTKSEIARQLKRTVSEIFRMLLTLQKRGYISQLDGDRYSLTLQMFRLAQEHPPTERLLAEALPVMQELAEAIHQSCHMGVIEGTHVVILAQVNGPDSDGFYVKLGSVVDILEAATGQTILAYQSPVVRDQVLARWKAHTGRAVPRDLKVHLAKIEERGVERRASYRVKGITNLSAPIFGSGGMAVAALTVPYIERATEMVPMQEIERLLQAACQKISEAIGSQKHFKPGTAGKKEAARPFWKLK